MKRKKRTLLKKEKIGQQQLRANSTPTTVKERDFAMQRAREDEMQHS